MGVFEYLIHECPCGREVEFQSKAGDSCGRLDIDAVPIGIAKDLNGETKICNCGRGYVVRPRQHIVDTISMEIVET